MLRSSTFAPFFILVSPCSTHVRYRFAVLNEVNFLSPSVDKLAFNSHEFRPDYIFIFLSRETKLCPI